MVVRTYWELSLHSNTWQAGGERKGGEREGEERGRREREEVERRRREVNEVRKWCKLHYSVVLSLY